jgi:AraC-like DNA-binding protein
VSADASIAWTGRPPSARRPRHVGWIWSARGTGETTASHRVLPDACADVVVGADGRAFVVGPLRAARVVDVETGVITGVRLRPGAAPAVLGVPAHALLDAHVPLADVAPLLARRVEEALAEADPGAALEVAIARHARAAPADPEIDALVARLWRDGDARLAQLAREIGLSERQLRRRCREQLGHAPAELMRVIRLRRLLRLARALPHEPLAGLAAAAGWHDQQHMTRDVRRLTGLTPARLLRRDGRSVQDRRAASA